VYEINSARIDEIFYNTIVKITNRLQKNLNVNNPTDASISLLSARNHYDKMQNWLNRLSDKIGKLDVLFKEDCTQKDAYKAWFDFFNHDFWQNISLPVTESLSLVRAPMANDCINYFDTEEYIEDYVNCINDNHYSVKDNHYSVKVTVKIEANGIHQQLLSVFLRKFQSFQGRIPKGLHIDFYAETDCPNPYAIWWKVRNVGEYAENNNQIRGQIIKDSGKHRREESKFPGPHFVECYVIKNDECVALTRLSVNIGKDCV
jgi:hypothetical protein